MYIGESDREISIEQVENDLLGTTIEFEVYAKKLKLDESEAEELKDILAGEIEQCEECNKWTKSWAIDMFNKCTDCSSDSYVGDFMTQFKQF